MSGAVYCTKVSVRNSTRKRGWLKHFVEDKVFSTTDDCGPFLRFGRSGNWGLLYLLLGQVVACQANHSHPYFIRKAIEGAVGLLPGSTWLGWWGMCIRCCPRCYEMKEFQWWHVMAPQRLVRPNPLWSNISRGLLRWACFLLSCDLGSLQTPARPKKNSSTRLLGPWCGVPEGRPTC